MSDPTGAYSSAGSKKKRLRGVLPVQTPQKWGKHYKKVPSRMLRTDLK